jgi:spore maturation protein CgeB
MGFEMYALDVDEHIYKSNFKKFHHHLNIGPGIYALNKKILTAIDENRPDLIWIDNKSFLERATIKKIKALNPQIKIVNVITDDITGKLKYQWRLALRNAKYFDCFFVQRKVNIRELKQYGAKRVELCYRSFDPGFHRPVILNEKEANRFKTNVGFVGTYEDERADYIAYLIENSIPVKVTGDGWPKGNHWKVIAPYYCGPSIYGEDYIKIINGMDIALHFLRHGNRDEQDSRTFEIPACGVFMLAENSDLHSSLFEPDKEAVFFETKKELLEKITYYLSHVEERETIAKAGLGACKKNNYSHEGRLKSVIDKITGVNNEKTK